MPVEAAKVPPAPRLPWMLSVPAPVKVNLALFAVPLKVMLPETLIVPVLRLNTETRFPGPAVMAMLAADNDPAPTLNELVILLVETALIEMPFVTVSEFVPLIVMPLAAVAELIVILDAAELTSTVTV